MWCSDDFNSNIYKETLKYAPKFRKTIKELLCCSKGKILYYCDNCDSVQERIYLCHNKYCTNPGCVTFRKKIAYRRLQNLGIKSKRVYHFVIGSNVMGKTEIQKLIVKLFNKLPNRFKIRIGNKYRFPNVKVFDIGRKSHNNTSLWHHFHIFTFGKNINVRDFMLSVKDILKDTNSIFHNIGWRSKDSVYHYFAKRIAGVYGHKGNYYYLKDIMSLKGYFDNYFTKKILISSIPEGLACKSKILPDLTTCCKNCGFELKFLGYDWKQQNIGLDPPFL